MSAKRRGSSHAKAACHPQCRAGRAARARIRAGPGRADGRDRCGQIDLLDALGLALGTRADAGLVRAGEDGASVSAEIELPGDHPAHELLREQGIEPGAGEPLVVRRTLKSDGGSRAFIAGAGVPPASFATSGAWPSRSTASMTTAGCSIPRATAICSTRLESSTRAGPGRLGGSDADRSRAGRRRAPRPPRPSATANGWSMQ